jgi:hypothetical protein
MSRHDDVELCGLAEDWTLFGLLLRIRNLIPQTARWDGQVATVVVQFEMDLIRPNIGPFIPLPALRSRQQAYFYL